MKWVQTEDGSLTLLNEYEETYHSTRGAVGESLYTFVEQGLLYRLTQKNSIHLLEVGMGTGLNIWLSALHTPTTADVHATTLEPHPIEEGLLDKISYPRFLSRGHREWNILHKSLWEGKHTLHPGFHLQKSKCKIQDFKTSLRFDVIYYDAFSPNTQEEMWSLNIFTKLYRLTAPQGVLVTYCSKGLVKRHLREAGFQVKRLPGALGKHHMLRATRLPDSI